MCVERSGVRYPNVSIDCKWLVVCCTTTYRAADFDLGYRGVNAKISVDGDGRTSCTHVRLENVFDGEVTPDGDFFLTIRRLNDCSIKVSVVCYAFFCFVIF